MLKFSKANAKIEALMKVPALQKFLRDKRKVYSLDLLSGWSCPFAKECLSKVHVRDDGSRFIKDGPHTKFRCFSASQEALYPAVYDSRKHNFDLLKAADGMQGKYNLLCDSLPYNLGILRWHVGGGFFNQDYFDAAVAVAETYSDRLFYAYMKSLPYWMEWATLPDNLVLTASRGGRRDDLIDTHSLREAIVILEEQTAFDRGLEIDHDDSHAANPEQSQQSFALLIHGTQPKGSDAGAAVKKLKGKGSYSRKKGGS
jgi:hypothetical protein